MLTKLVYITLKCFILSITPFDFIIGCNTIQKHHLVNEFPDYFGLLIKKINDITKETKDTPLDLPSTKVRKVTAAQNTYVVQVLVTVHSTTGYSSQQGLVSPRDLPE